MMSTTINTIDESMLALNFTFGQIHPPVISLETGGLSYNKKCIGCVVHRQKPSVWKQCELLEQDLGTHFNLVNTHPHFTEITSLRLIDIPYQTQPPVWLPKTNQCPGSCHANSQKEMASLDREQRLQFLNCRTALRDILRMEFECCSYRVQLLINDSSRARLAIQSEMIEYGHGSEILSHRLGSPTKVNMSIYFQDELAFFEDETYRPPVPPVITIYLGSQLVADLKTPRHSCFSNFCTAQSGTYHGSRFCCRWEEQYRQAQEPIVSWLQGKPPRFSLGPWRAQLPQGLTANP
jgi:hypothetical protein